MIRMLPKEQAKYASLADFNRSLPWRMEIRWLDKNGFVEFAARKMAKIRLSTRAHGGMGTVGSYNGYKVEIIDADRGKIDSDCFPFNPILGQEVLYTTNPALDLYFHVWSPGGGQYCWYCNVPAHPERITQAVEDYVEFFLPKE